MTTFDETTAARLIDQYGTAGLALLELVDTLARNRAAVALDLTADDVADEVTAIARREAQHRGLPPEVVQHATGSHAAPSPPAVPPSPDTWRPHDHRTGIF